jgi:hypothetical protein
MPVASAERSEVDDLMVVAAIDPNETERLVLVVRDPIVARSQRRTDPSRKLLRRSEAQ